jgi:photosystem II stability/assembly factor-like uncharacterized protein
MHLSRRWFAACFCLALVLQLPVHALFAQNPVTQAPASQAAKTVEDRYGDEGEDQESDFLRKRMQWFHDQRAYPHQTIPRGIRQQAVKQMQQKRELESSLRRSLSASPNTAAEPAWKLIGPQPIAFYGTSAGRVTSLAIDPTNSKTMYMGGAEGGIWKSTNAGATWTPISDQQVTLAIGSITIDPNNHNTLYIGTGEENFSGDSYYGAGILKSTNGGETWTQMPGGFTKNPCGGDWIGGIAVQPGNSLVLLAAVESCYYGEAGIYRSADGGQTWTAVYVPTNAWTPGTAILFDHTNGKLAYAATDYGGVLKSTDGGVTWNLSNGSGNNALPTNNVGRIALAMAPSNTSILYAAIANSSTSDLLGLYKSVDAGANWSQLGNAPNFCSTQCWYDIVLAVNPTNPNHVVAGGVYTYHPGGSAVTTSLDGGVTWNDQSPGLHPDTHALAFTPDGNTLYTGNDGGVWYTTNPTATQIAWTELNDSLAIAEFYPGLAMDPGNVNHTYVGAQDNGTQRYSGALSWPVVACGDGGATLIDYASSSTVYTNCIEQSLYKSTDDGQTFTQVTSGFDTNDRTAWVPPLAMDPENPSRLYFGTYRVYQSTNAAASWKAISGDLTDNDQNATLNTIAVAPSNANTVYAGSGNGKVYVTLDALSGAEPTWTNVTGTLPNRGVNWIAVDPSTASTAYVGFSGFTGFGDKLGHIFKTTNSGSTWTDISSDLPNTPVDAILVDPDAPSTIFLGTDIGAFYTTNGGTSWATLGTGLPNVVVTGLGLHENSRTLRASTHGRSVWDLSVATLLPIPTISSVGPAALTAGGAATKLTVTGYQFQSNSVVVFGGKALATTFGSTNQITATVPATSLAKAGTFNVGVMNGSGGKLSNLEPITIDDPVPAITALSKASVLYGSPGFTLTVSGSKFVAASKVLWNGKALATTFVNAGSLSAPVPTADLAKAGTANVSVQNPTPGGGTSNVKIFQIQYPLPVVKSLSPASLKHGGAAFTLTVNGSAFVSKSVVKWNGTVLATTFVSATKLTAAVPKSDLAKAGTALVTVDSPTPGGGNSTELKFTIE